MSLIVVGLVLSWLIIGLLGWLGYHLVRQYGRILLRLDALDARLAQLAPAPTPAPHAPPGLPVGSVAPAFELPDLQGGRMTLEHWRGQRVLLMFFNPGCGFCQQMAPDLAALPVDGHDGRPLPLVITTGDPEASRRLVTEHGLRGPVLLQQQMEVAAVYHVRGTPMGYVIDERGMIASELAVGAQALLALATPARAPAHSNGHKPSRGNRSLADSRLNRHGLPAGTPAPHFRLPRLEGGEVTLEAYRGQRVLLVFSDPNCGPCDRLAPQLEQVHRHAPTLQVLMVSRGDPEANRVKVAEHGLTFPVALQRQWEISRAYGMFATPIGYLIDEEGIIMADVAVGVEPILALPAQLAIGANGQEVPRHGSGRMG
jgi:peroxiredoxin